MTLSQDSILYFRLVRSQQAVGQEAGVCWKFPSDSFMKRMTEALNGQGQQQSQERIKSIFKSASYCSESCSFQSSLLDQWLKLNCMSQSQGHLEASKTGECYREDIEKILKRPFFPETIESWGVDVFVFVLFHVWSTVFLKRKRQRISLKAQPECHHVVEPLRIDTDLQQLADWGIIAREENL